MAVVGGQTKIGPAVIQIDELKRLLRYTHLPLPHGGDGFVDLISQGAMHGLAANINPLPHRINLVEGDRQKY